MRYLLAIIAALVWCIAGPEPVAAQTVSPPPGATALVCAYNASIPAPVSGEFFYVQCDSSGNLITSGGGGTTYTFSTGLTNTANTITLGDTDLTYSAGIETLGKAGTTVGEYCLANATSGTVCIEPTTGALGTSVATLPANTGTVAEDNINNNFSVGQTMPSLVLSSTPLAVAYGGTGSTTGIIPVTINAQTGTSYTFLASDQGKLVTASNTAAQAYALPQATGSFAAGFSFAVQNTNTGIVTITPTTSTINGKSTLLLYNGQGVNLVSDGTNWQIADGGNGSLGLSATINNNATLYAASANILQQYNSTSPQVFRVYNSYTDASDGEWGGFDWTATSNILSIGAFKNGTGTLRNITLLANSVVSIGATANLAVSGGNHGLSLATNNGSMAIQIGGAGTHYFGLAPTTNDAMALGYNNSGAGSAVFTSVLTITDNAAITLAPNNGQVAITGVISTSGYTVASLPSGVQGDRGYVTDQLTACVAAGVAVTGGGSVVCPVFYNGSAWVGD